MNTNNKNNMPRLYITDKPLNTPRDTTKIGWENDLLILGQEIVDPTIYMTWLKQNKTSTHYEMLINTQHPSSSFRYYFDYDFKWDTAFIGQAEADESEEKLKKNAWNPEKPKKGSWRQDVQDRLRKID